MTGPCPGPSPRDLSRSIAFSITTPSGGISPSSASMRPSSVAQPPAAARPRRRAAVRSSAAAPPSAPPPAPAPARRARAEQERPVGGRRHDREPRVGEHDDAIVAGRRGAQAPRPCARAARRRDGPPLVARSACDPCSAPRRLSAARSAASSRWCRTARKVTDGSRGFGVATSSASKSANRSSPVPSSRSRRSGRCRSRSSTRRLVVGAPQAIEPHEDGEARPLGPVGAEIAGRGGGRLVLGRRRARPAAARRPARAASVPSSGDDLGRAAAWAGPAPRGLLRDRRSRAPRAGSPSPPRRERPSARCRPGRRSRARRARGRDRRCRHAPAPTGPTPADSIAATSPSS